jgi:hypothetical protein
MAATSAITIYTPPRKGLPYLVVTVEDGEVTSFTTMKSRTEARTFAVTRAIDKKPPPSTH